jgi:hypothetical protein
MRSNCERSTGSSPISSARPDTSVPFLFQVKEAVETWKEASGITEGALFRSINKTGRVWGNGMTARVLWEIVREAASRAGIEKTAAAAKVG